MIKLKNGYTQKDLFSEKLTNLQDACLSLLDEQTYSDVKIVRASRTPKNGLTRLSLIVEIRENGEQLIFPLGTMSVPDTDEEWLQVAAFLTSRINDSSNKLVTKAEADAKADAEAKAKAIAQEKAKQANSAAQMARTRSRAIRKSEHTRRIEEKLNSTVQAILGKAKKLPTERQIEIVRTLGVLLLGSIEGDQLVIERAGGIQVLRKKVERITL